MSKPFTTDLDQLNATALRALARQLMGNIQALTGDLRERDHALTQTRLVVENQAHDIPIIVSTNFYPTIGRRKHSVK